MESINRILVVDDDLQIVKIISKLLEQSDIETLVALSVKEAIKILDNIEIDLLIVDYTFTNGNGLEIVKKAKHDNARVPIIMVSAANNLKLKTLEFGVDYYLDKPFNGRELKAVVKNLLSLSKVHKNLDSAHDVIMALLRSIEARDIYTKGHSERVSFYALSIFDYIGFDDEEDRDNLISGCLLHDIGKIAVPDYILKSNKKLDVEGRIEINKHPLIGYNICKDLKNLKDSLDIIKYHHEKLDGSGYPEGLVEKDIPYLTQIVTISDIFDALTSDRSYRKKNTIERAFEIIEEDVKKHKLNKVFFEALKSSYS